MSVAKYKQLTTAKRFKHNFCDSQKPIAKQNLEFFIFGFL